MKVARFLFFFLSSAVAAAQVSFKELPISKDLPDYVGNAIKAYEIVDKSGHYVMVFSKLETGKIGENGYLSEFRAYKYIEDHGGYLLKWEIKDFGGNALCSPYFDPKNLSVVDIDKDGLAETMFLYQIACDGLDPDVTKLLLHYKNKKYAIRGEVPKEDGKVVKNMDKSFDTLPPAVKKYASDFWDKTVKTISK